MLVTVMVLQSGIQWGRVGVWVGIGQRVAVDEAGGGGGGGLETVRVMDAWDGVCAEVGVEVGTVFVAMWD